MIGWWERVAEREHASPFRFHSLVSFPPRIMGLLVLLSYAAAAVCFVFVTLSLGPSSLWTHPRVCALTLVHSEWPPVPCRNY